MVSINKSFFSTGALTFYYLAYSITLAFLLLPAFNADITCWWLDNLLNLQIQWSLLGLILIVINISYIKKYRSFFSILTITAIFYNFMPLYFSSPLHSLLPVVKIIDQPSQAPILISKETTLNIAQLNLSYDNPNLKTLVPILGNKHFDLLVIQEASDTEFKHIKAIAQHYPYSFGLSDTEATPSGMAIFSRWPIIEQHIHPLEGKGGQILEVILQTPKSGTPVQVYAIHPSSPRSEALWLLRNNTLNVTSERIVNSPFLYKIAVGDFNSSLWSHSFKAFQQKSQLGNSAKGFGYVPSWSYSKKPFFSLLSSAYIDHILICDAFTVVGKSAQFIPGSDHLLLLTELSIDVTQQY